MALAEHLAGSADAFVARMNQRAGELGMNDTNFVNPRAGVGGGGDQIVIGQRTGINGLHHQQDGHNLGTGIEPASSAWEADVLPMY